MTEHCPQDGGFIGDAGCTHQNHEHSQLVKGIIDDGAAKKLRTISELDCEAALTEGFYVNGPNGKRIGFGKSLLRHFNEDHDLADPDVAAKVADRKRKLLYAVNAVMFPARSENNHERIAGRTAYFKRFPDFGIQAITSKEGDRIEYVFTHIVKYSEGTKKGNGAARSLRGAVSATALRGVSQTARPPAFPPRSVQASCDPIADAAQFTTSSCGGQAA